MPKETGNALDVASATTTQRGARDQRKRRIRLVTSLLALPLGLLLTDLGVKYFYIDAGHYQGPPLPPFTVRDNPNLEGWFAAQLDARARGRNARVDIKFDRELGWTNHTRKSRRSRDNYNSTVNSIGARSTREYTPEVPAGALRLACFGDSFTYCSEVGDHDSWTGQLEEQDPTVEAINFGVAGYGLDQALLRFRRKTKEIKADVVVIGFQIDALPRIVSRCRAFENPLANVLTVKPRFRLEDGELVLVPLPFANSNELLECALAGRLPETLSEYEYWGGDDPIFPFITTERIWAARRANQRRFYRKLWSETDEEPYRVFTKVLSTFREEALSAGAREVLVLILPNRRDRAVREEDGSRFLAPLRAELEANQYEVINYDQRFRDLMAEDRGTMFLKHHFNTRANALVAGLILEWVESRPDLRKTKPARDG